MIYQNSRRSAQTGLYHYMCVMGSLWMFAMQVVWHPMPGCLCGSGEPDQSLEDEGQLWIWWRELSLWGRRPNSLSIVHFSNDFPAILKKHLSSCVVVGVFVSHPDQSQAHLSHDQGCGRPQVQPVFHGGVLCVPRDCELLDRSTVAKFTSEGAQSNSETHTHTLSTVLTTSLLHHFQGEAVSESWADVMDNGTNYCSLHNLVEGDIISSSCSLVVYTQPYYHRAMPGSIYLKDTIEKILYLFSFGGFNILIVRNVSCKIRIYSFRNFDFDHI